jgi:hypothetical protein
MTAQLPKHDINSNGELQDTTAWSRLQIGERK